MMKYSLALVLSLLSPISNGEELPIFMMEVPPLTINSPEQKGVVGEIVQEAMRRAGYSPMWNVVPNNRALAQVASPDTRNTLIIPLARIEDREAKFTWIASIVKVNRAFFSLDQSVQSFAEARAKFGVIGVSRGTAGVSILRAQGFAEKQIYEINQGEVGAKMLLMRRIDAWYGPMAEGIELIRSTSSEKVIQYGAALGPSYNYLACSKACDPAVVDRLSTALKAMERDGSARTIRQRYGYPEH